jgi:hypothetical protein
MANVSTARYDIALLDYDCDAWEWLSYSNLEELSDDDMAVIKAAEAEDFKILAGTKYIHVSGRYEGESFEFRARLDLDAICRKNDIYEN